MVAIAAIVIAATPCIAAAMPEIGNQPPVLSLPNLQNKTVNISDFSENPVILAFFASWSDSCKKEMQTLNEIYKEHKASGLKVVAVSFDKKPDAIKKFTEENKIEFEVLFDKKLKTIDRYAILIIPTAFTIDRKGNISDIYVDYDDNVAVSLRRFAKDSITDIR